MNQDIHITTWIVDAQLSSNAEGLREPIEASEPTGSVADALAQLQSMTGAGVALSTIEEPDVPERASRRDELLEMERLRFSELLDAYPDIDILDWAKSDEDKQLAVEVVFTGLRPEEWNSIQTQAMVTRLTEEIKGG